MKDREILDLIQERVYNVTKPQKEHFFEDLEHYDADDTIKPSERKSTMIERILEAEKAEKGGKQKSWGDSTLARLS